MRTSLRAPPRRASGQPPCTTAACALATRASRAGPAPPTVEGELLGPAANPGSAADPVPPSAQPAVTLCGPRAARRVPSRPGPRPRSGSARLPYIPRSPALRPVGLPAFVPHHPRVCRRPPPRLVSEGSGRPARPSCSCPPYRKWCRASGPTSGRCAVRAPALPPSLPSYPHREARWRVCGPGNASGWPTAGWPRR